MGKGCGCGGAKVPGQRPEVSEKTPGPANPNYTWPPRKGNGPQPGKP